MEGASGVYVLIKSPAGAFLQPFLDQSCGMMRKCKEQAPEALFTKRLPEQDDRFENRRQLVRVYSGAIRKS